MKAGKVLIVAPFWGERGHVGSKRVERFLKWFQAANWDTVLVRAGSADEVSTQPWGTLLTIKDPLGMYRTAEKGSGSASPRRRSSMRKAIAYFILSPDPSIVWAKYAVHHPLIKTHAVGALWVLSTSPPESSHIAAMKMAKNFHLKLAIDMRDGWLDDPLKPILRVSRVRKWREGWQESQVMKAADRIFVTSNEWAELLVGRVASAVGKVSVLSNGYPLDPAVSQGITPSRNRVGPLRFLHAGRFLGSRGTSHVEILLEPLLLCLPITGERGEIVLIGELEPKDREIIETYRPRFLGKAWVIKCEGTVTQETALRMIEEADGLLLLSTSHAAVPSKLFEYLMTGKAVLSVALEDSAVWRICEKLPQVTLVGCDDSNNKAAERFYSNCASGRYPFQVPNEFRLDEREKIFFAGLDNAATREPLHTSVKKKAIGGRR